MQWFVIAIVATDAVFLLVMVARLRYHVIMAATIGVTYLCPSTGFDVSKFSVLVFGKHSTAGYRRH
jgi:O-antigen ligase